ncbi:hypothetical protein NA56DRAFT_659399 [Hyaloscypha hepaticicola]|uniref:Uncharacterized protein n=1 Tax=Hyaloscypha hepaticicola TaxID=2082293 RepID=A0A2J6Q3Q6_9HELO|nr:hypothetical protein NA56DRAFT_659399 [Hyaloscypha hepaticicola]
MAWDETEVLSFAVLWAVLANLHREGRGGGPASAVHVQHPARKPAPITHAVDITTCGFVLRMGRMGDGGGGTAFCEVELAAELCRDCTEKSHLESARLRRTPRPPRPPRPLRPPPGSLSYGSSAPWPRWPRYPLPAGTRWRCSLAHGSMLSTRQLGSLLGRFWDVNQTVGPGLEKRRASEQSGHSRAHTHATALHPPFPLRPKHSLSGPYPRSMEQRAESREQRAESMDHGPWTMDYGPTEPALAWGSGAVRRACGTLTCDKAERYIGGSLGPPLCDRFDVLPALWGCTASP